MTLCIIGGWGYGIMALDIWIGVAEELKVSEQDIIKCKVEFIQPSNWLYSVPNLLVIQHLVTLYLGGIDVRVESEIE